MVQHGVTILDKTTRRVAARRASPQPIECLSRAFKFLFVLYSKYVRFCVSFFFCFFFFWCTATETLLL